MHKGGAIDESRDEAHTSSSSTDASARLSRILTAGKMRAGAVGTERSKQSSQMA